MAVRATPLFDRYTDAELIGAGAIGEVYRATDSLLGRLVAVKVLTRRLSEDAVVRQRFVRETLAAAPVSAHPHVVTIYDVGERDGQAYAVMDYLPGGSLEDRLQRDGPLRPDHVAMWLEQAAAALDRAHAGGIVHGNLKPANLLLDARGQIQVADFGAAGALGLAASAGGDRYALAATAFELLSGRAPVGPDVPPISAANRSLPRGLDAVFATALAGVPAERYRTCGDFAAALRAAVSNDTAPTLISQRPPTPPAAPAAGRSGTRSRVLPVLAGLFAVAALGAGVWAALLTGGGTQARRASPPTTVSRHARRPHAPRAKHPGSGAAAAGGVAAATTADAHALNDRGFALMRRGDYRGALPLLERSVRGLAGQRGDPYDGYANYNLGVDLIKLGRCAEALPHLTTAKQVEPYRPEVDDALAVARRCAGGRS